MSDNTALIVEAKEHSEGWITGATPYRPFDQGERIRYWRGFWDTITEQHNFNVDVAAWEDAHGHDMRLKCYPEFGCQVIESYGMSMVQRLTAALEQAERELTEQAATIEAIRKWNRDADGEGDRDPSDVMRSELTAILSRPPAIDPSTEGTR